MTVKKAAIFVEGQTEMVFVERLLKEIAGEHKITLKTVSAGSNLVLTGPGNEDDKSFFALIVDCQGDSRVKSKILDNRTGLIRESYEVAIGLLDLYPLPKSDLPKVIQGLNTRVPTKDLVICFCLSVMEIESWFIQEHTHFERIDPSLTRETIRNSVGYDPEAELAEDIEHPSELLRDIYSLVGMGYSKRKRQVERTVDALDYEILYLHTKDQSKSLKYFIGHIDQFVSS